MDSKNQFANKARTDDTTDYCGSRIQDTSIDRSDLRSCSFAEENRQNVGCTSSSRGLTVDEFLIRLIKYEKSMFLTACIFLALPSHERQKLAFGKWPIMRLDNFF